MGDILIVGFLLLAIYGIYLWLTGRDPDSELTLEINRLKEKNKSKAPIIYLRSFASETLQFSDIKAAFVGKTIPGTMCYWKDAGDTVTDFLSVIGPVHALARPQTDFRMRPWAPSRPELITVDNDRWQQQILEWLPEAALVVVQLDVSTGLDWELQQLIQQVRPIKVLLVLPPTQAEYDRIREGTSYLFPKPLPVELPESRVITFRPDWQPWPLLAAEGGGYAIWKTLEPIFQQNGYESPPWRRIWEFGSSK